MITDIFLWLVAGVANMVLGVLNLVSFVIPDAFETAITSLAGYLGYFQGVLPIVSDPTRTGLTATIGLVDVFGYWLQIVVALAIIKGALWTYHLLPFIGKRVKAPKV